MSNENKPYPSRLKNKKNRSNSILNIMIGLVFALILIVGAFIFLSQNENNENAQEPESVQISTDTEEQASEEDNNKEENTDQTEETEAETEEESDEDPEKQDEEEAEGTEEADKAKSEEEEEKEQNEDKEQDEEGSVTRGGTITREKSNDPVVDETIINTSWEAVGTDQSGEHVSVYDEGHVDWKEKIAAISYATGLSENDMFIMRVENGGGPQKSVGTVQSKDKSEKYRVHMEWVDGKGWKPVKMDVLKTLEGAY